MSRLFSANMMRLGKSRVFLLGELFMVGYAFFVYDSARSHIASSGPIDEWNLYFFNVLLASGIVMALFVSVFLGVEYHDGTIRNKLMVGHRRRDIYLVNYVTCLLAGLVMCATYYLCAVLFGCLIVGRETLQIRNVGAGIICSILILAAYTAIFVSVEMLDKNKVRSMAVNLIGAMLILMIGMMCSTEIFRHSDTAGFMWYIIEILFPSTPIFYVAGADVIPVRVAFGLLAEAICFTGIGVRVFREKELQ